MPFSFTEIERQKTPVIKAVMAGLITFYVLSLWVICLLLRMVIYPWFVLYDPPGLGRWQVIIDIPFFSWWENLVLLALGIFAAAFHFELSTRNVVTKIVKLLGAKSPDPEQMRQLQFGNILGELTAATGGEVFEGYVIPSQAVNALAVADFDGRQAICVTQGLLRRLQRPQVEAVCAHEAAHLLSGDSLDTTVLVSLFNLPTEVLRDLSFNWDSTAVYALRTPIRGLFTHVGFWFMVALLKPIGFFVNLFLSRQREYRADAIAVRLCRDPLSLAEALYKASFFWHGAGMAGERLAQLYIIHPRFNKLEESEGLLADLFSTHPPLRKRLAILLDMAHVSLTEFKQSMAKDQDIIYAKVQTARLGLLKKEEWMVRVDNHWSGPYEMDQLHAQVPMRPDTLVKRLGNESIMIAAEDPVLKDLFTAAGQMPQDIFCPKCHWALKSDSAAGQPVHECPRCGGILVAPEPLKAIIQGRKIYADDIVAAANMLRDSRIAITNNGEAELQSAYEYVCPYCRNLREKMRRRFYGRRMLVEIDECLTCLRIWLDKDELEILQCLSEQQERPVKAT